MIRGLPVRSDDDKGGLSGEKQKGPPGAHFLFKGFSLDNCRFT